MHQFKKSVTTPSSEEKKELGVVSILMTPFPKSPADHTQLVRFANYMQTAFVLLEPLKPDILSSLCFLYRTTQETQILILT